MSVFILIGFVALLLGAAGFYLASPNQRWLAAPLAARPARIAGGLLLALGWLALAQAMQLLTASFVGITFLMLVFTLLPYLGAWPGNGRGGAK